MPDDYMQASYYHALKMTAILYIFLGIFLLVYGPSRKAFGIALVVNLLHAAEHWIFHDQVWFMGYASKLWEILPMLLHSLKLSERRSYICKALQLRF